MSRVRILPYRKGSKSVRALAEELGVLRLKFSGSRFVARPGDVVINWGSSTIPDALERANIVNDGAMVKNVSNKLLYFQTFSEEVPEIIPPFWTDAGEIPEDAYPVMCRTHLSAHSGIGIVVANNPGELVPAPLYVQYIKKKQEYRVHVGSPNITISVQRKARKLDVPDEEVNWMIRNHSNGFVFVRNDVNPPEQVIEAAHRAVAASGLDFGACDVIYNEPSERAYVLEINTAPGLEGSTVKEYADFLTEHYLR